MSEINFTYFNYLIKPCHLPQQFSGATGLPMHTPLNILTECITISL